MVRLGFGAYMRCPVGKHWALVRAANEAELTEQQRQTLERRAHLDDQDGVKLNSSIGLLNGLIALPFAIAVHSWWGVFGLVLWLMLWGAVFIRASR